MEQFFLLFMINLGAFMLAFQTFDLILIIMKIKRKKKARKETK